MPWRFFWRLAMRFDYRKLTLLTLGLLASGGAVYAASGDVSPYLEGSFAWPRYEEQGYRANPTAGVVRFGFNFDRFWSLEALGMFGFSGGTVYALGIPVS